MLMRSSGVCLQVPGKSGRSNEEIAKARKDWLPIQLDMYVICMYVGLFPLDFFLWTFKHPETDALVFLYTTNIIYTVLREKRQYIFLKNWNESSGY